MTLFSRLRSRSSRRSHNTEQASQIGSDKTIRSWFRTLRRSPTTSEASRQSRSSAPVSSPMTTRCTHLAHQRNQLPTFGSHDTIDLMDLQQACYFRRKSSLSRQSVSQMLFKEEVRSLVPVRCSEYVPFVLESSSEGIEMELDDLPARPRLLDAVVSPRNFWASVMTVEGIHVGENPDDKSEALHSPISNYATYKVTTILSLDQSHGEIEESLPSARCHPKKRPAAIDISKARPSPFVEHQCNLSETFRSVSPGQWPGSAISLSSSTPTRPRTAATVDSDLIFDWWRND